MDSVSISRYHYNSMLFVLVSIGWICGEWGEVLFYSSLGRDKDSLGQEESLFTRVSLAGQKSPEPLWKLKIYENFRTS